MSSEIRKAKEEIRRRKAREAWEKEFVVQRKKEEEREKREKVTSAKSEGEKEAQSHQLFVRGSARN